jgi:tetratricopeptide (TPR) repeat protein
MPKKPAKKSISKKKVPAPIEPPANVEDALRQLVQLMSGGAPVMESDMKALMTSLQRESSTDGLDDAQLEARADAQDLAFEAMETESKPKARKLAQRALRLDPDCVDALMVLTDLDAPTMTEVIVGYTKAVEAGERALGEKFIRENKGDFWLLIDTRPYMRALEQLASVYFAKGMNLDAIRIYEKMLELNPNDNQGVRDPLLGVYLCTGDLQGAGRLLKQYKDDAMANFAWGRVLERFLAGDPGGAAIALEKARRANHFVELYLTAEKPIPRSKPEMYSPGSEEEALLCIDNVGRAWALNKEAVFWLLDQRAAVKAKTPPSKAALKKFPIKGKKVQ